MQGMDLIGYNNKYVINWHLTITIQTVKGMFK